MEPALRNRIKLTNPAHFLALGFGSGLIRVMPGTFGSLAAIPLVLLISVSPLWGQVVFAAAVCVVGIWVCGKTARAMGVHDHGAIVWDEVAGMVITFIAVPISFTNLLIGFLLFRFLDILKPWPISALDKRIHGGTGIMLDDIVAGILAMLMMHGLLMSNLL